MRTSLVLAVALAIGGVAAPAVPSSVFAADDTAPAADQAVRKYVLTVAGMT